MLLELLLHPEVDGEVVTIDTQPAGRRTSSNLTITTAVHGMGPARLCIMSLPPVAGVSVVTSGFQAIRFTSTMLV